MEIVVTKTIPREVIENIFITALEGGSNYWYYLSPDTIKIIRSVVSKKDDEYLSTAILKAILDHDVEVPINDAEDEDEVIGYISKDTMQERLQKLAYSADSWALDDELNEKGDAVSSDVVFQYITMGEIVYG
jgi:hypothetical protein